MHQANHLGVDAFLDRTQVLELLREKIDKIDWASAKADIHPFIADPGKLDIWSSKYFHALIEHLLIENSQRESLSD